MTLAGALMFFAAMIALAAMPSASVALVVIRSTSFGVRHGMATALGIAAGDLVWVVLALSGLVATVELFGAFFALLRVAAAGYLIWFGIDLIRRRHVPASRPSGRFGADGIVASFAAGIVLTLGDVKAILFYAALFPVLVDVSALTVFDTGAIAVMTVVAVTAVKAAYALVARRLVAASSGLPIAAPAKTAAGCLMVGGGGYLLLKGT